MSVDNIDITTNYYIKGYLITVLTQNVLVYIQLYIFIPTCCKKV